ncbi:hypothetical protein RhiirA1_487545 [Rhizophagus irregularis]|uniref:Uncharacterized protein n=1 Tax=Rhizophagus irregularis TaxID=588596 RepID=A0A2N0QG88_9GLOM|nr:hypothetical protein RhiirA1_487545 [Rhizophagus irregularis]
MVLALTVMLLLAYKIFSLINYFLFLHFSIIIKNRMINEYFCPFLCNTGKACGNPCIRPEGYQFHWKAKKRVPCSDCGKPIASACGRCPLYVRGYYTSRNCPNQIEIDHLILI